MTSPTGPEELSEFEKRQLAEIDAQLQASDPDLVSVLARPVVPQRRQQWAGYVYTLALIAALLITLLDGLPLALAAALLVATLAWGVWLQTWLDRRQPPPGGR